MADEPPYPDYQEWMIQVLLDDGTWGSRLLGPDLDRARADLQARRDESPDRTYRMLRITTAYAVEED